MKLVHFYLAAKDHTTEYNSVEKHVRKSTNKKIVPIEDILNKDFVVDLAVTYKTDGSEHTFKIMSYDTETLMAWVKEQHPELYELIPPFNIEQFQFIANKMNSASYLSYQDVTPDQNLEYEFGLFPEPDDFIPERETVDESVKEIVEKGFYTEIQCYPDTPVGFWDYYGTDFQSLLDHITKD